MKSVFESPSLIFKSHMIRISLYLFWGKEYGDNDSYICWVWTDVFILEECYCLNNVGQVTTDFV